ncbi:MAG: lipase family protein [Spirulinaceae cyanobacterium RM2_2_10]|nr:lipase family protein [Spirulinaceae cyanobacterium SM2_1_0]NJO21305.1 lipase family protein [Spirulinaceae cyanobacterium RM2_2_10]
MTKLVFLMHGVAVRDAEYGKPLQKLVKQFLNQRGQKFPDFCKGFWGDYLGETERTWREIEQELADREREDSDFDAKTNFRYQETRQGQFSQFVGDAFSYLNAKTGGQIRKLLTDKLKQALDHYQTASEIYFVAHSLGTAILWDILFSNRFAADDPALDFRALLRERIALRGIVTMGSPIAFINMTLGTTPQDLQRNLQVYVHNARTAIPWLNFVHASDLIAYPIRPLLKTVKPTLTNVDDIYLTRELQSLEGAAFSLAQSSAVQFFTNQNPGLKSALDILPGIAGTPAGHTSYFADPEVARRIARMLYPKMASSEANAGSTDRQLKQLMSRLRQVPGMTEVKSELQKKISQRLDFTDEVLFQFDLKDNLGSLILTKNILQVHHVTVADRSGTIQFFGYVGLIHGAGLRKAVETILSTLGLPRRVK